MSHADTQHVLRDVSKYYVTFYCAKDQSCEANLFVNQKATQFLMNTEFHATVRAVIIEMSDTRKLSRQPMDQTRC